MKMVVDQMKMELDRLISSNKDKLNHSNPEVSNNSAAPGTTN